jgi:GNAT superfamily N-acetyltransferase
MTPEHNSFVPVVIREYREGDSVEEITVLLNRAYADLASQGLRYVASWQTPKMTLERIEMGTCCLALDDDKLVGTVMLHPPDSDSECDHYRQPGMYHFGKFGVEPERRGEGIGRLLFDAVEKRAIELGATELACDTAAPASHLIELYKSWGFEIIANQNWSMTNYESVIMSKRLLETARGAD